MSRRITRAAALAAALSAVVPSAAHAAPSGKPDLRIAKLDPAPAKLAEGTTFAVRDTVRNAGRGGAPATTVRFYLTTDATRSLRDRKASTDDPRSSPTDILLTGARELRPLRGGGFSAARKATRLQVPGGTPAGRYVLLACADDRAAAKERREHDNCTAATRPADVAAAPIEGEIVTLNRFAAPLDPDYEAVLPLVVKQDWCAPTRYRKLTAAEAVRRATAELKKVAGADAFAAFKASPSYRSAAAAQQGAAGALAQSQPGAALAAMLRAHQLEPREASHLVNAAALAGGIGLPNEALGMLDQAARLDDPDRTPMGIPRAAMLQAVRAQSLVRVGRFAQARTAATAAAQLAPMLTEPHGALAAADLCEGRDMIPAYRKARKRTSPTTPVPPHPIPPDTPWVDDSTGVPGKYSEFTLPGTPMDAPYLVGIYRGKTEAEGAWIAARNDREGQLREALRAKQDPEATVDARAELLSVIHSIHGAPDLQALDQRFTDELNAARNERAAHIVDGDVSGRAIEIHQAAREACANADEWERCVTDTTRASCIPATNGAHSVWLKHLRAANELAKAYLHEYGRRVSGTAAHLSDPSAYELGLMAIADRDHGMRGLVLQEAFFWTGALDSLHDSRGIHLCIATPNPAPEPAHTPDEVPAGPGACQGDVKDMNLVIPLPGSTLKLSCEALAVEVSGESWITAFVEVKVNFRSQEFSVFAGSKADLGFGPMRADFKSGLYFTAGPKGVQDFGMRAGPSRTLTTGVVEWNPSDTVDISIMELFKDQPQK